MTLTSRQYQYDVISLLLTGARSDKAQGLTKKINTLTIITLGGSSLSVKLNASTNNSITLSDGFKIEGIPISELYWTHIAQAGLTAKVFVAWID